MMPMKKRDASAKKDVLLTLKAPATGVSASPANAGTLRSLR